MGIWSSLKMICYVPGIWMTSTWCTAPCHEQQFIFYYVWRFQFQTWLLNTSKYNKISKARCSDCLPTPHPWNYDALQTQVGRSMAAPHPDTWLLSRRSLQAWHGFGEARVCRCDIAACPEVCKCFWVSSFNVHETLIFFNLCLSCKNKIC